MSDSIKGAVQVEVDDQLDLHHFSPKDLSTLIPDYLQKCMTEKIFQVRIIHGKGIGNIRRSVHAILEDLTIVQSFSLAPENRGSWGATIVVLKKNN